MFLQSKGKSGNTGTRLRYLAAGACSLLIALSTPATATSSFQAPYSPPNDAPNYKHQCPDGLTGFKIDLDDDYASNGHEDGATGVVFKLSGGPDKTLNWSAHHGTVYEVAVAGGGSTYIFKYDPAVYYGDGLYAPDKNNKNTTRPGVSHVTFCYAPVKADIKVTKTCKDQRQTKSYDGFITRNQVVVRNTGNVALKKVALKETLANCKVIKIDGQAIDPKINLTKGSFVDMPNLVLNSKGEQGDSATITVRCRADEPNVPNRIVARGETHYGYQVKDAGKSDPYTQCKFVHETKVRVEKTCMDDSVHLRSVATDYMGNLLAVRVCPSIVIQNKSTEPLHYIKVTDPSIPLLASGKQFDHILSAGAHINLADWVDDKDSLCYYPDAPGGYDGYTLPPLSEAYQDLYDPNTAAFFNEVTVYAKGKYTGHPVEHSDSTYKKVDGEWVAECPLCSCPDCEKDHEY